MTFKRGLGADGYRTGWFAIAIDSNTDAVFRTFEKISELWNEGSDADPILIDMPIGLSSKKISCTRM
jgi:predicted RNase H-like nuclease